MIWLQSLALVVGIAMVFTTLRDAFETIVLPRRPTGRARLTVIFYRVTWWTTRGLALRLKPGDRRERVLSYYGPLWMISLIAAWAVVIMLAFALIHWGIGSDTQSSLGPSGFWNDLYISGTTLFTLGMGDIFPSSAAGRVVTVIEAGLGLGFLALVIGYLPVLYTSFSRREVLISLFDARAGSPSSAAELLRRSSPNGAATALSSTLEEFERWAAELLESHLSYPVLAYYRSQHDKQSWLGAITTILDTSAVLIALEDDRFLAQARLTFAMARHTVIDLAQIFEAHPADGEAERLAREACASLVAVVRDAGLEIPAGFEEKLDALRATYEPAIGGMARHLVLDLPGWLPEPGAQDDWETSLAVLGE
jgi:hypothetical protein